MSLGSHNLREDEDIALGPGAALLIGTLRRIAAGRECAALSRRDFAMAFPGDADEVFVTFRAFLQSLAHAGRRKLRVAPPGSGRATPDETSIIALIAAAQTGDAARLDAHLCWLARGEARLLVAVMTRALATALGVHGQWLRSDEAPPPARASAGQPCLRRCADALPPPPAGEESGPG